MNIPPKPEYEGSALDSIEHSLYDPKKKMDDVTPHHVRDKRALELPTSWGDNSPVITEAQEEKGMSFGVKFLLVSIFVLVATLGFTAWKIVSLRNVVSDKNIDMSADITPYVEGGETVPVSFALLNRNVSPLQSATLTIMYEQGSGSQDEQAKIREKRDLGVIKTNELIHQDFNVTLYGSEAESRDLTFKLEYKVAGSQAIFSKTLVIQTVLKTPPIVVKIDGPKTLSIGQSGVFSVTVKNNAATSSLPSVLQVTLPNTFTIQSQDPKPNTLGSVWSVPSLKSGDEATYTITGSLSGSSGETVTMKALVGSKGENASSIGIVYSSQVQDIKLRTSPLSFLMNLETDSGSTERLRYGDKAVINVIYTNGSDMPLQDVSINLALTGDASLYKQIDPTSGNYDSVKQVISWDKTNIIDLASLPPHANGTFRVIIPIVSKGNNSPVLKALLSGSATTEKTNDVVATLTKKWTVEGSATISTQTTFKSSPFVNNGPIPPQANTETTYAAHMIVSAQNALVNTRVSFILPSYVTWRGVTTDNDKITYDKKTRTVTWAIGNMEAGKTITADIGLSVKPSQSHVGKTPAITSGIVLDADEEASQSHIRTTISSLTTHLTGEVWDVDPDHVVDR